MKSFLSILFLSAILWQPFYQTGYIAYWEVNKEKIAQTECINRFRPMMHCNGKCQLYAELKKAADEEAANNKLPMQVLKLKNLDTFIEMPTLWQSHAIKISKQKIQFTSYSNLYSYLDSISVFHPPSLIS